jgi:alpha-tubulin suppressor-like RCC1 family protein
LSPSVASLICIGALLLAACSHISEVLTPVGQAFDAGVGSGAGAGGAGGAPEGGPDAQAGQNGTLTSSSLNSGQGHTCATLHGVLYCWGDNARGQLGLGDTTQRNSPARVGALGDWSQVAAGATHSCALRSDGAVYCFGGNDYGQLGQKTSEPTLAPMQLPLPSAAASIASEVNDVCIVGVDGALLCWGDNAEGQIGQDDPPPFSTPLPPTEVGTDRDWALADTGQGHTCGLRGPGDLYCWGRDTVSQLGLGDGSPEQTRTPTRVGTQTYVRIHAGQDHTCGIGTDGALYCWGLNMSGNLGTGDRIAHSTPTPIGPKVDWQQVSLYTFHSCAIDSAQHLFCWGRNVEGQLGVGDTDDRLSPTQVDGEGFTQVAVGLFHTCALKTDDTVWCTGIDDAGELGLGDTDRRNLFTQVQFPP